LENEELNIELLYIDEQTEAEQISNLQKVRASRDNGRVKMALQTLKQTAIHGDNLLPPMLDCVRAYASVGEIVNELRDVFGEYADPAYL
jgi:methylmalonyl-CoA mutase N-terminal domain/subunit